jgi:hypothetical protein
VGLKPRFHETYKDVSAHRPISNLSLHSSFKSGRNLSSTLYSETSPFQALENHDNLHKTTVDAQIQLFKVKRLKKVNKKTEQTGMQKFHLK